MAKFGVLSIILTILLISACSERERNNPFDPANTIETPIDLSIRPYPDKVELNWSYPPLEGVQKTLIYRAVDDSNAYEIYEELDGAAHSFVDTRISPFHWYYYRVTLSNGTRETSPSNTARTYSGPTTTWLLSENGFQILQLSYDLQYTLKTYNTFYPDHDWHVKLASFSIWLVSRSFAAVSRLSLKAGEETFIFTQGLKTPVAVAGEGETNNFYVLDNGQDKAFYYQEDKRVRTYSLPRGNYLSMAVFPLQDKLFALNETTLYTVSLSVNRLTDSLTAPAGFTFYRMVQQGIYLLVIANEYESEQAIIYWRAATEANWQTLQLPYNCGTIAFSPEEQIFVVSKMVASGPQVYKDNLVKLSTTGTRLWELSGFKVITDIQIDPETQTVVVADRLSDHIVRVSPEGAVLFTSKTIYDPIRVYVQ